MAASQIGNHPIMNYGCVWTREQLEGTKIVRKLEMGLKAAAVSQCDCLDRERKIENLLTQKK
jgi:hypothetical protein